MNALKEVPLGVFVLVMLVFSTVVSAQKGGGGSSGGSGSKGGTAGPSTSGSRTSTNSSGPGYGTTGSSARICGVTWPCPVSDSRPLPATPLRDDSDCFLPPVQGIRSSTVSVAILSVPEKAKHEYDKACSAVHHKNWSSAEDHLNHATAIYSRYAAAWVLLGQVQERKEKEADAAQSCNQAMKADLGYAPAYLCLAYLAEDGQDWVQMKQITDRLLQLHPLNTSNAYYYNALANLNLQEVSSAERSARLGVADSAKHHQPELHLLLARIYRKKGDRNLEQAELREYLKRVHHGDKTREVNTLLDAIDKQAKASDRAE